MRILIPVRASAGVQRGDHRQLRRKSGPLCEGVLGLPASDGAGSASAAPAPSSAAGCGGRATASPSAPAPAAHVRARVVL
jgi:hypothetical protein